MVILLLCVNISLHALELEAVAGAGNMAFDPESEQALDNRQFAPNYFALGHISLKGKYSDMINFSIGFEHDAVLRSRILGTVGLNLDHLIFSVGPFFGAFNTPEQPLNAGITGALRLEYPGIIFGTISGSSTLGSQTSFPGDYTQSAGEVSLGFWLPNVIPVLSINAKSFTKRIHETLLVRDELIRYQFSADVFSKNVPYTIRVDMGYESLKRSYTPGSADKTETDELKSLYLGFEGTWQVSTPLKLILGLEMPVFSWAEQPMKSPARDSALFQFHAGAAWKFGGKE